MIYNENLEIDVKFGIFEANVQIKHCLDAMVFLDHDHKEGKKSRKKGYKTRYRLAVV